MVSEKDNKKISVISEKYSAKRVLLFGSSVSSWKHARDIDMAVEGMVPGGFLWYYNELLFELSRPVDVIDFSKKTKFT